MSMATHFDQILHCVVATMVAHREFVEGCGRLLVNIDLNGRVVLVAAEECASAIVSHASYGSFTSDLLAGLGPHAPRGNSVFLFEADPLAMIGRAAAYPLPGWSDIHVVDRQASNGDWGHIAPVATGALRVVFHSIKGGVGRSTALAVAAATLAARGHKVMVVDLDLASPGLSSNLITDGRSSTFGIVDWLVEDLVNNGDALVRDMVVRSNLELDGDLVVVAAHGRDPGQYISKLGRVWMQKPGPMAVEPWDARLRRLLDQLESSHRPDIVLIDSRSGIDEFSSACVTELGADLVLMFASDAPQTWTGYTILMKHWQRFGSIRQIRTRLQCVAAASATADPVTTMQNIQLQAWDVFRDHAYDAEEGEEPGGGWFNFDLHDSLAPHRPWLIHWVPRVASFRQWQDVFGGVAEPVVRAAFEQLIQGIEECHASTAARR